MSSFFQTISICQLLIWMYRLNAQRVHGCQAAGDQHSRVNLTNWNAESGSNLTITWDTTALDGIHDVKVIVYEFSADVNNNFSWKPVNKISSRTPNKDGRISFVTNHTSSVNTSMPRVGAIGVFELNETKQEHERRAIWSDIHALNWLYPINSTSWCQSWMDRELSELHEWPPQRSVCPCTERQARRDIGSFNAFLDCRLDGREEECSSHRLGAMFCVYSNTPSRSGTGQECCYNNDGHLIESGSKGAGFWFSELGPVSVLSHYLADTMPYLQCCVADQSEGEELCDLYRNDRPPNNCYGYRPPQPALAFGDPHFITFDGLNYTFNGYGEFTLANFNEGEFILQARSLPMAETPNATIFKAVATKTNTSDVIHVESNHRTGVSVFFRREGRQFEKIDFDLTKTWHLRGVTVKAKDDLSIVFDNDIALKMTTTYDGALEILVMAPYRFKDKTQGMMGTWNDDTDDDLRTPDDVIVSRNSSMEQIFHEFGNLWRVKENDSLFYYKSGFNQSSYTDDTYTPLLIEPSLSLDDRISDICGIDQSCAFDFFVTRSEGFANQTLNAIEQYRSTIFDLMPVLCQPVSITNGRITSISASPGSLASFSCNPCYELSGDFNTTCGSNGTWLKPLPSCVPTEERCDRPTAPPNGNVTFGGCQVIYANFTCKDGYKIRGTSSITCMPDGKWSHRLPKCKNKNIAFTGILVGASVGALIVIFLSCIIITALAKRLRQGRRKRELEKRLDRMWSSKNQIF